MTEETVPTGATLDWSVMHGWAAELLNSAGMTRDAAAVTAENMVYAERCGFSSHGFIRLPVYAHRVRAGGINAKAQLRVIARESSLAVIDADGAPGAYSARAATSLVIELAQASGSGIVLCRNANHFGAAGQYSAIVAEAGLLGLVACNSDALMCHPDGGHAVLGSNPLSVAVPLIEGTGPHLDMATTQASYGKILVARERHEQIPSGWAVDEKGSPTSDPAQALAGALLPAGGPKGFGLAFMIDCLLAAGGAATSPQVGRLYGDPSVPQDLGHAFFAVRIDVGQEAEDYTNRITSLSQAVRNSTHLSGGRTARVPGDRSAAAGRDGRGWSASPVIMRELQALAGDLGVAVPPEVLALLSAHD